ncbi:uncharacterized protein [Solanum tuberosum]|uniref:uncharacterized protein n=1 Tax=Solanum tuberosum TaxID=4113 RepID=UPI00073A421F|nr:PREDICTED: uncharacterized protein LOC107058839 [Solanum tuberosum]
MSPYQLVYRKSCHLLVELEHKAIWALNKLNLDWGAASYQGMSDLNVLDEFRLRAYYSSALYKEKMKKYHDRRIEKQKFVVGDLVLLFNYSLHLFQGMLKSKLTGPFLVMHLLPYGAVDLENSGRTRFKVNRQRIKVYLGNAESVQEVVEAYYLDVV